MHFCYPSITEFCLCPAFIPRLVLNFYIRVHTLLTLSLLYTTFLGTELSFSLVEFPARHKHRLWKVAPEGVYLYYSRR